MINTKFNGGDMRERAFRICRDYLHGTWKYLSPGDLVLKRISGGLSNWLYLCTLPATRQPRNGEPSQVLLRMYGQIHGERAMEGLITESVIFTLLSERRLGPRLHGVFPGGRLEEYIPARPLLTRELADPKISALIGEKMARVHAMNVPISKEPRWLWDTMSRWMQNLQEENEQNTCPQSAELLSKLLSFNLHAELKWLRKQLSKLGSPVVFCHNDLQEGNILLRESPLNERDSLVLIDFEYCAYSYRAFDLANHFCEWMYDYTLKQAPNFEAKPENYPSREQQLLFIRSYLATWNSEKGHTLSPEDIAEEESNMLREIRAFTLASHFLWALWGLVNSKISQIPFGYLEYANMRLDAYFAHKAELLASNELKPLRVCDDVKNPGHVPGQIPGQDGGCVKRKAEDMLE